MAGVDSDCDGSTGVYEMESASTIGPGGSAEGPSPE